MSKAKSIVTLIFTAIVVGVLAVLCFCSVSFGIKYTTPLGELIGKGIDLSGGYYVVLTPKEEVSVGAESEIDDLERAMNILRERLDKKGYTEATISVQDSNKIRVEVPEVDNAQKVLEVIGSSGEISFRDSAGNVLVKAEHIKSAYASYDATNGYVCVLNFTDVGTARFSEATKAVLNSDDPTLYIYLGDEIVSQPSVNEQLTTNSAIITGYETLDEADAVASVIESGRLPIEFEVSESRSVSARLGETAITNSLIAAAIGIAIIFIIMIVFYRGLGIAASIALALYSLCYIALLALVPNIQLTLPGIAGIILSIGMAVDANVVIFERIKHEFGLGKTVLSSIDTGFKRAIITVIDSNVTTILSSIVLWILCPGTIKGFAITLLIGIVLSMLTSIFVTRWYIKVLMPLGKDKEKFLSLRRKGDALNA